MKCEHGNEITIHERPIDRRFDSRGFGAEMVISGCGQCQPCTYELNLRNEVLVTEIAVNERPVWMPPEIRD